MPVQNNIVAHLPQEILGINAPHLPQKIHFNRGIGDPPYGTWYDWDPPKANNPGSLEFESSCLWSIKFWVSLGVSQRNVSAAFLKNLWSETFPENWWQEKAHKLPIYPRVATCMAARIDVYLSCGTKVRSGKSANQRRLVGAEEVPLIWYTPLYFFETTNGFPWKMLVGRLPYFFGIFSGDILVSGRVAFCCVSKR